MYSLNVPVPGEVRRLAADLHPQLVAFDRLRERHTLAVKRFPADELRGERPETRLAALRERLRPALSGAPRFEARIDGVDYFAEPVRGPGPVVYLRIKSPGLVRLHERLVDAFGAIDELEGEEYVPHVTLARGGPMDAAERLRDHPVEPISWTVSRLVVWDPKYREPVATYPLPA